MQYNTNKIQYKCNTIQIQYNTICSKWHIYVFCFKCLLCMVTCSQVIINFCRIMFADQDGFLHYVSRHLATNVRHHQPDCPGSIALIATARSPPCIDCTVVGSPPSGLIVFRAYWQNFPGLFFSQLIFQGGSFL